MHRQSVCNKNSIIQMNHNNSMHRTNLAAQERCAGGWRARAASAFPCHPASLPGFGAHSCRAHHGCGIENPAVFAVMTDPTPSAADIRRSQRSAARFGPILRMEIIWLVPRLICSQRSVRTNSSSYQPLAMVPLMFAASR